MDAQGVPLAAAALLGMGEGSAVGVQPPHAQGSLVGRQVLVAAQHRAGHHTLTTLFKRPP